MQILKLSDLREKHARAHPSRPKGLRFFNELSAAAQENAIKNERDDPHRFYWDDAQFLTEDFREQLSECGFEETRVYWSLGYCQGDGVAFYGRVYPESLSEKDEEAKKLIDALKAAGDEIYIEITGERGHYHHWNSMSVEIEFENETHEDELPSRRKIALPALRLGLEEYLAEKVKEISRNLEKSGYAEIEYRFNEDVIREELESGERLFEKDGTLRMSEFEFYEWKKARNSEDEKSRAEIENRKASFVSL